MCGLVFLNDGQTLVSAGTDHTIKLFDVQRLESRLTIEEDEIFSCLAVTKDNAILAAGTREGSVFFYFRDR